MVLRLIHTSTLRLQNFIGAHIPEYAILSHTWTNNHEISYQDMKNINLNPSHPASEKSGFSKISRACELARGLGLEYAWVDTCCIDKSSSAELSEAINSMFQWYQAAKVCLVYLSDLPPTSNLYNRMPRCKWFTRGWCLQELIAPRVVKFYNCRWDFIGSKSDTDLMELVSSVSRIDKAVLADTSVLPSLSVAKKMSWAAQRETTKPEDVAYCLLGIFDVNMPLLYGEGPKAFLRLQEEIIKRSNDLSIFAWGHPKTTQPQGREYINSSPVTQSACCDLLAESARDFYNCGNLVLLTAAAKRNFAFSMTNNGIFFSQMKLRVSFESGCYVLPLLCYEKGSPLDGTYLALKKVGPDSFVRLRISHWENLFRWNQRVSGYVVTKMTPETQAFVENCHVESVQLHSPLCSNALLHATILEISPQETWDLSNLTFIHDDDHSFSGHVKFHGALLARTLIGLATQPLDDIYLVWAGGSAVTDSSEPSNVRETVWVSLCWAGDWAEYSGLREHFPCETDNIRRGSVIIEATVVSIGGPGSEHFRIDIKARSTQ